jgi:hypothetical protein
VFLLCRRIRKPGKYHCRAFLVSRIDGRFRTAPAGLMSRPIDIRVPIDNIYFWPTVDVRYIDSMPRFAVSGWMEDPPRPRVMS